MTHSILVRKDNPDIAIQGTLERLSGMAGIAGAWLDDAGRLQFDWEGGTEIYWDDQETQRNGYGERLFVDENGELVPESMVLIREEE